MKNAQIKQKNVERLLYRCEKALSGKPQFRGTQWRLEKYISALEEQISELDKYPSVDSELLTTYRQKLGVFHAVLSNDQKREGGSNVVPVVASQQTTPVLAGNELLLRSRVKKETSLREELFSKSTAEDGATQQSSVDVSATVESVMERHDKMQEEIAEDMVKLAQSLKHRSIAARDILHRDTKVLENISKMADENIEGIDKSTNKMKKDYRGCSCWIWCVLVLVFLVFLCMVIFIRIFPKPSS